MTGQTQNRPELRATGAQYRISLSERLKNYVVTPAGCWEWQGYRNQHGYGRITVKVSHRRYALQAVHRVAYEVFVGPIPAGEHKHDNVVMHACDNRACIKPDHLRLGTQADNLADMRRKDRTVLRGWRAAAIRGEIKSGP